MVKCVITTLDNLKILKEQITILSNESIDEIIVVNNGSIDGTKEWLDSQSELTIVNHVNNNGPSIGRNSGIDKAGKFDYVFLLDGGIRPLIGGIKYMLDYMESTPDCDVIGVEIPDMITDYNRAWRIWPYPIAHTYVNTKLSHTAYCLARYKAFDNIRFCTEGPFGVAGVMCEDDELMCQWLEKNIRLDVVSCQCNHNKLCTGVHPYRNASGSFRRLYKETGIWPNQFGSVYEQRLVWLQQNWAKYSHGVQWGAPEESIIIECDGLESTIKKIKSTHDKMRKNRFEPPYEYIWHPYEIIITNPTDEFLQWAEPRRLRQHHGDTILINKKIIKRNSENEHLWTGDFKIK